jgi:hypothetical protein
MTQTNGVRMACEHDWDRTGRQPSWRNEGGHWRENNIHPHSDEFSGEARQIVDSLSPPEFDGDVVALDITEIA